ncbi:MAG: hypothetical protein Q4D81_08315 [Eubacteriales bacterium]|nr:hypothetical protein [Eubacteriales bacterium]
MLIKLLGYEMKAFGRIILPLYAATMGMALVIGLGIRFLSENMFTNWIGVTIVMIFSILVVATMVMTGVLCVQRFYHNLLGNEGYLMFSLPVGTHELILSKVLGSLIWTLLGGVAAICIVLIMGVSAAPVGEILEKLRELPLHIDWTFIRENLGEFLSWCGIGTLSFTAMLMQIYAALAVGHQWTGHRILGSVIAYFGFNVVKSILSGILGQAGIYIGMTGVLVSQQRVLTGDAVFSKTTAALVALVTILIYSLITWVLLDRRLNLE